MIGFAAIKLKNRTREKRENKLRGGKVSRVAHLQEDSINDTAGAQFVTNERTNERYRWRCDLGYRKSSIAGGSSPFSFLRAARARCGKHSMHKKHDRL